MAGLSIGELFVSLGFDFDDTKLKSFNEGITNARNELLKVTAAATGAVAAIYEFISTPINRASQYAEFTKQLGYSSEEMQKWARVASTVNSTLSFDEALAKYKAFSKYVQQAGWGGGFSLGVLGVEYAQGKDPSQYLEELSAKAGKWQAMLGSNWRGLAIQAMESAGLGADYIDALLTTAEQRVKMTKGLIQNDDDVNKLDSVNKAIQQILRDWEKFAQDMTEKYGDRIIKFLHDFETEIEKLVPEIDSVVQSLGGWVKMGEIVLAFFVGKWALGIVGAIASVTAAISASGLLPIATLSAGFLAGKAGTDYVDKKTGFTKSIANYLEPTNDRGILDHNYGHFLPDWFYNKRKDNSWETFVKNAGGGGMNNNVSIYVNSSASPIEVAHETKTQFETLIQKLMLKARDQTDLGGH